MKMSTGKNLVIFVLSLAAFAAISPMARAAGSLEPNAPPGPVMKSLDEVEPRIPIKASDFPLTITSSGSYYLTQDVNFTSTGQNALVVDCNDVTIDLMGYTITGPNSTTYSGIYMNARTNVEIRNGTIRNFRFGINENSTDGRGHRIINIRAVANTYIGIQVRSNGNLIKDCTATKNGSMGIYIGDASTIIDNTASYNASHGICNGEGCTVTGNTACWNSENGFLAVGGGSGSTLEGNTASRNTLDGINASYNCSIIGNNCHNNGNGGDGAGIHVTSKYNRIEQNNVGWNDRGIDVDDTNNLIVKNSSGNNTAEYDIVGGNQVGTISTDPTTAGPWDNFDL